MYVCSVMAQSILKEINPECSLEGQILKLRFQYFGHLMRREDSLEKTLVLGRCEGKRRRRQQRTRRVGQCHQSNQHEFDQTPGQWKTGGPGVLWSMGS